MDSDQILYLNLSVGDGDANQQRGGRLVSLPGLDGIAEARGVLELEGREALLELCLKLQHLRVSRWAVRVTKKVVCALWIEKKRVWGAGRCKCTQKYIAEIWGNRGPTGVNRRMKMARS